MTAGRTDVDRNDLQNAMDNFIPSAQGLEKELQEIVAVLECTELAFLTPAWREQMAQQNGRSLLQERSVAIRQMIDD
jgi:hypothetical protein